MKINKQLRFFATSWYVMTDEDILYAVFLYCNGFFYLALHTKSQMEQKIDGVSFGGFFKGLIRK